MTIKVLFILNSKCSIILLSGTGSSAAPTAPFSLLIDSRILVRWTPFEILNFKIQF